MEDVGILIRVSGVPYALFDDGEFCLVPEDTVEEDENPLIFDSFDEVVEFMTIDGVFDGLWVITPIGDTK